jgi:hypothetical protein
LRLPVRKSEEKMKNNLKDLLKFTGYEKFFSDRRIEY